METTAIYPGTFDPVTQGHLDIVERSIARFKRVVVAVSKNPGKSPLFSLEERIDMVRDALEGREGVSVVSFEGLLVDLVAEIPGGVLVKGLRAVSDFDYELQMAQMNARLKGVETFFMAATPEHSFLSSSLVKEVARYGGDISSFVTPEVARRLKERAASG
ncbi:MAG: pantetheine-phosphate adenylyltransferase [Actinomycetota bacterium]